MITGLIVVSALIFYLLELNKYFISCAISLFLESVLLFFGKVKVQLVIFKNSDQQKTS